jgi:hypothetical protein
MLRDGKLHQSMPDRLNAFTERARRVLQLAQEEAQRLNHHYIGTGHLLLGLIREADGVAGRVLLGLGLTAERVREAARQVMDEEHPSEGSGGLTLEAGRDRTGRLGGGSARAQTSRDGAPAAWPPVGTRGARGPAPGAAGHRRRGGPRRH